MAGCQSHYFFSGLTWETNWDEKRKKGVAIQPNTVHTEELNKFTRYRAVTKKNPFHLLIYGFGSLHIYKRMTAFGCSVLAEIK